jgi:hypothetical protein
MSGRFGAPGAGCGRDPRGGVDVCAGRPHTTAHQVERVRIDHAGNLLTRAIQTCLHLAPMPTAARDQARYVRSGRPLINWLEAYSASQVVDSDPVGSVDLVPVLSPFLPASMGA